MFTVAVAGALGSGAAIANAAPTIERGSDGAAPSRRCSARGRLGRRITSNVRTPGLQIGDETRRARIVREGAAPDESGSSNVHTPGLQTGDETSAAPAHREGSTAATPPWRRTSTRPGCRSAPSSRPLDAGREGDRNASDSEFLGVNTQDVTDALIAGGVLLAIAGATFAGTRRPGSARPA